MSHQERGDLTVENRKYPRSRFLLGLRLAPLEPGKLPKPIRTLAADVGAGGMSIHSEKEFTADQLLTVILYLPPLDYNHPPTELPEYCESDCVPVTILCRVVWCRREGERRYKLGLAFMDIEQRHRKFLKHFLVEYELDEEVPDISSA
jgi:c-di-GMP-binding flagellar brake protein YcgR